jgi:hypothetical protein
LTNVVKIAAGMSYSLALRGDGSIVAWGNNYSNRCSGASNIVATAIAAGYVHNLAIRGNFLDNVDTDGDGMSDQWEIDNGFDRSNADDASQDSDGDGLSNLDEFLLGTPPRSMIGVEPSGTQVSAPVYGPGVTGLLILTPSSVRN